MSTKVGLKGQVVIEKGIRDALGVVPGSIAVQRVVGDRVEIRFLPAEHRVSLHGILAAHVNRSLTGAELERAIDDVTADAAAERYRRATDG